MSNRVEAEHVGRGQLRAGGRRRRLRLGASGWAAGLAGLALIAAAAPACSVVVDGSAQQCSTNDDCGDFPGTECNEGICKTPTLACVTNAECGGIEGGACIGGVCLAQQNSCETTAECIEASGENFICKRPIAGKKECVSLLNEDCVLVEGDYQNDAAVIIGAVLPIIGQTNDDTGESSQNGARLALREIAENAGGIPGSGGERRPLVLVSCDATDKDVAVRSATYLTDTVGVQAIIGSSFSGVTLGVATEVTIPRGVLLFSASATSEALTDLADKGPDCLAACAGDPECEASCPGLFWRTSPSDTIQSSAMAAYMPIVEDRVRTQYEILETEDIKVLVLNKGDSYGQGISTALEGKLEINGSKATGQSGNYERFNYGNPDDPQSDPTKYPEAVELALDLEPHVIFVLGTDEGIEQVMKPLEDLWENAEYRPHYILGDGGFIGALVDLVDAQPTETAEDDLRRRIRGGVPGTSAEGNPNFGTFVTSFSSTFSGEGRGTTFGAAGSYDIAYLLALSAAAAGDQPLTGTTFARGLLRTVPPGEEIRVGPSELNTAFGIMTNANGGNVDFQGASGPLDFDIETGQAVSDILIWCMSETASGENQTEVNSGLLYVAAEESLAGEETECN